MDDPLIEFELHASTVDLIRSLLSALGNMSDGTGPALTTQQRSYLAQAMDLAADLDIVFEELTETFERFPPPADPN